MMRYLGRSITSNDPLRQFMCGVESSRYEHQSHRRREENDGYDVRKLYDPHEDTALASGCPGNTCYAHGIILSLIAHIFEVPEDAIEARSRCNARVALARQSAMYLAHVCLGLSFTDVGRLFRRDRTTVSYACRTVEERRDDPEFDTLVGRLEHAIAAWWSCRDEWSLA